MLYGAAIKESVLCIRVVSFALFARVRKLKTGLLPDGNNWVQPEIEWQGADHKVYLKRQDGLFYPFFTREVFVRKPGAFVVIGKSTACEPVSAGCIVVGVMWGVHYSVCHSHSNG